MAVFDVQLLDGDEVVDGHVPAGHVTKGRAARFFGAQIPEISGQVCALDDGHGVEDGLLGGRAVVFGGQRLEAKVAVGAVCVRRVERDEIGEAVLDHGHALPGRVGAHAVQVGLDVARREGVLHEAAFVLFEARDDAPADESQRTLVQLEYFREVGLGWLFSEEKIEKKLVIEIK